MIVIEIQYGGSDKLNNEFRFSQKPVSISNKSTEIITVI